MNIFIGFGYNNDDKWIKELVFPLVEAFDGKVFTGEEIYGNVLSEAVTERIENADGVLAFLTRREAIETRKYSTHRWVYEELATAIAKKVPAVEIREKLVDTQNGLPGNRQRIEFDLEDKTKLLVELARLLSSWKKKLKAKRFFLMPGEIVVDVRPFIKKKELKCTYQFMTGNKASPEYEAKPFLFGQGLCVDILYIPSEDSLLQVSISGPNFEWSSRYESVQLLSFLSINLEKSEFLT